MKHNKCPHCKSIEGFIQLVTERKGYAYNYNMEGQGATDSHNVKENKTVECMSCHKMFRQFN